MILWLQTIIAVCLSVSLHSIAARNVRLNRTTGREGRLEVFYNGTWGTVCGDSFNSEAASVACFSLGFRQFDQYWTEASPVPGDSSSIWLAGIDCYGSEPSLFDCEHVTVGDHDCSHGEDIYLNCTEPDIDECLTNNGGCSTNAVCSNTAGSFTCACTIGYNGNGYTCTDINECLTNNGGCSTNAVCSNTPGRFTCQCKSGYEGSGYNCTAIISFCSKYVDKFVAGNGTITSPNYQAAYLLYEQCQWLIVSSLSNGAVRLLFDTMSIDPRYKFVELYNGYNALQPEIQLLSGSSYSAAGYSTTQRYMFIAFISTIAANLNSFSASYSTFEYTGTQTIDGVTYPKNVILLNAGTGTFTSPNYPGNFPFLAYFEWLIVSSSASGAVRLRFNRMSIAPGFDFVIMYDGFNASFKQIERISGALPFTNSYSTTQRYMFITFTSNAQTPSTGFQATFSTFEYTKPTPTADVTCPPTVQDLTTLTGTLTTPNYPRLYPILTDCQWLIKAPSPYRAVKFQLDSLSTDSCCVFLTLYDGRDSSATQLASLSGSSYFGSSYSSTQRYMYITFTSNNSSVPSGFRASYTTFLYNTTADSDNCGSSSLPCLALIVIALVSLIPYCLHHVETDHIPAVDVLMLSKSNHHTAP